MIWWSEGKRKKGREEKTFRRERRRGGKESKKVKVDAGMNEGKRTAKRGGVEERGEIRGEIFHNQRENR